MMGGGEGRTVVVSLTSLSYVIGMGFVCSRIDMSLD